MKRKAILVLSGFTLVVTITCAILLYNGIIWFNNPSEKDYPVRVIDVSSYQGIIDWNVLSQQDIDFA
jgi:lysozyme